MQSWDGELSIEIDWKIICQFAHQIAELSIFWPVEMRLSVVCCTDNLLELVGYLMRRVDRPSNDLHLLADDLKIGGRADRKGSLWKPPLVVDFD